MTTDDNTGNRHGGNNGSQPPCEPPSGSATKEAWIAGRIETLLSHYFQPDHPIEVAEAAMIDWIKALRELPRSEISDACESYLRDQPRRRPTPGDIYHRVSMKMQFKARHQGQRMIPQQVTIDKAPDITPEEAERRRKAADRILETVGYGRSMREALEKRPMATTREEALAPRPRRPHWSEIVDPDGPEMQQLRRARIAAGMIKE